MQGFLKWGLLHHQLYSKYLCIPTQQNNLYSMKKTKTNFSTLLHRSLQKLSFIFMIVLRLKENQKVYNIQNYNLEIFIKTCLVILK